jgi:hypothetical protein
MAALLEPVGNIPPAEAEERYYAMLDEAAMAAYLNHIASGKRGAVHFDHRERLLWSGS